MIQNRLQSNYFAYIQAAFVLALSTTIGCLPKQKNGALTNTVGIPQTEIKDQGKTGFCWAYSFSGMVESWALSHPKTPEKIELNPEYIGFHRLAIQLQAMANTMSAEELATCDSKCKIKQGSHLTMALDLINKFGVIPESLWTAKNTWRDLSSIDTTSKNLLTKLKEFKKQKGNSEISLQEIIDNVMVGEGVFPPLPKIPFNYEGSNWTPQSFATQKIGFDASKYKELLLTKPEDYNKIVTAIKRSLARGIAVPLGIHYLHGKGYNIDAFEAAQVPPEIKNLESEGGHIVLITDFINQGDDLGAMSEDSIKKSLAKNPDELSYFVVKNSWGLSNRSSIPAVAQGYNIVDQGYLHATLAYGYATVAVPEDIFNNPSAPETNIAPMVSNNNLNLLDTTVAASDTRGHFFEKAIEIATIFDIIPNMSDGLFHPNKLMSREYLVTIVVNILKKLPSLNIVLPQNANLPFKDVANDRFSAHHIAWAQNNSLLTMLPISKNRFGVEMPLTRKETKDFLLAAGKYVLKMRPKNQNTANTADDAENGIIHFFIKKELEALKQKCSNPAADNPLEDTAVPQNTKLTRGMMAAALLKWKTCRFDEPQ